MVCIAWSNNSSLALGINMLCTSYICFFFFLTLSIFFLFLLVILQHIKPVINLSPLKVEPTLQNMLPVTTHIRDPTHTKSIGAESALFIMQI